MLADVIQEILARAARTGYRNEDDTPINLVIALTNGVVYRGQLVDPDEWLSINSIAGKGHTWVGRRGIPAPGSWPEDVKLPDDQRAIKEAARAAAAKGEPQGDPTYTMIFMTMVEYLSGDRWVTGSSMATDVDKVVACGDQYS